MNNKPKSHTQIQASRETSLPASSSEIPKGFKMTELGSLPEEWQVVQLKEVADFSRKPRDLVLKNFAKIPFISMDLIPDDGTTIPGYIFKPGNRISSGIYCEPGDILLAKITPCLENGKQCVVPNFKEGFAFATTEVYSLKPKHGIIDRYYLFAFLRDPTIRKELASKMEGSTGRQRLPKHVLGNLEIPLPPLPEQRAIAYVLRTVQRAKEATERVIAALRELKKSLMKHLFTYGPVPLDQADRIPLKETEIGPVPEHWKVVKFSSVVTTVSGQVDPRAKPYAEMVHVGPENIEEATGRLINLKSAKELGLKSGKYLFSPEHVLYSKIRPYLRKAALPDFKGICSADMYALKPNLGELTREFLFYWLLSEAFTRQAVSYQNRTGIPKINRQQLGSTWIPLPPLPEQREIARILQTIDRKIEAEEKRKQALEAFFETLLHHLMTAEVRLSENFVSRFGSKTVEVEP